MATFLEANTIEDCTISAALYGKRLTMYRSAYNAKVAPPVAIQCFLETLFLFAKYICPAASPLIGGLLQVFAVHVPLIPPLNYVIYVYYDLCELEILKLPNV